MNKILSLVVLCLMTGTLMAQQPAASQAPQASVTPLTSKDLPDFPGKEVLMITVDYPPTGQFGSHSPAQCTRVRLCVGGLDNHAGERWKRSHADTGPNFL